MQWLTECVRLHEAENSKQKEQHRKNSALVLTCRGHRVLDLEVEQSCHDGE